jgi:HEAT repeat protein
MGNTDAIPRLIECLQDTARARFEERSVCDLAADALEQIGTKEAKAAVEAWRRGLPVESQVKPKSVNGKKGSPVTKSRLQQLIQGLFHTDWQRRVAAVEELSEINEVPVVPALLKAIKDEDHQVRWAAVRALEGKPDELVLKALLWALRDGAYLVSDAAGVALGRAGAPAIPGLLEALKDENPDVRGRAVEALGKIGDTSVVSSLIALLPDEATPHRETKRICDLAAAVLEEMGTPEALEALAQWRGVAVVTEPAAEPEQSPVQEAPSITQWEALSHLLETLHNPNWGIRERAAKTMREQAKALRGLDDPIVVNLLANALRDPDEFVRWAAVEALAWIKDDTTIPLLLEALHDKQWTVRLAVIRALIEIGDSNVTPALLHALNDRHTPLREAAAEALGRLGSPAAVPGLLQALGDNDGFVRRSAAEALGEIGNADALPDLIKVLQDSDAHVRWAAAEALGKIGDPAAVAPLAAKLNDSSGPSWEDRRICDVVADALESIGVPEAHAAVERWRNGSSLTYVGE